MSESRPCGFKGCQVPTLWHTDQKNPWGKPGIRVHAFTGKPHYHNMKTGAEYTDMDYEIIQADREAIERAIAMKTLREERLKKYPTLKYVGRGLWECKYCGRKSDFFPMEEHTSSCKQAVVEPTLPEKPTLDSGQMTLFKSEKDE